MNELSELTYETVNIWKIIFLGGSLNFYLARPGKHADELK